MKIVPSKPVKSFNYAQRGAALLVGLIMLVLITLIVTSAFTLSTTDLKSVGNMQAKDEAIAAANQSIEQVLSSPFTTSPAAEDINVDINNDGITDYTVHIATPTCVRASVSKHYSYSQQCEFRCGHVYCERIQYVVGYSGYCR